MLARNIHLHDFQGGPLVILELHLGLLVGEQGHGLRRGVQNVILRDALLGDGIDAGQEVGSDDFSIRPRGLGGDGGAVRAPQRKGHAGNRITCVLIRFADDQAGPLVVAQPQLRSLAGRQLHMVFSGVQNVIGQGGGFHHGVNSRLKALHQNLSAVLGGAVDRVAGVLDPGYLKGNTIQRRPVRAGFDQS